MLYLMHMLWRQSYEDLFNFFIKLEFYNSYVEELSHFYPRGKKFTRLSTRSDDIRFLYLWDKLVEGLTVNLNDRVSGILASPDTNIRRWSQRQPSSSRSQLSEILPFASTESRKNGENPFTSPTPKEIVRGTTENVINSTNDPGERTRGSHFPDRYPFITREKLLRRLLKLIQSLWVQSPTIAKKKYLTYVNFSYCHCRKWIEEIIIFSIEIWIYRNY